MTDFTKIQNEVQTALANITNEVREQSTKVMQQVEASNGMSAENKAKIDELLAKQGDLQSRLQMAEQVAAGMDSRQGARHAQTPGASLVNNEEFKAFISQGIGRGSRFTAAVDTITTDGDAAAGDLVLPHQLPGIVQPGLRRLTVRDLITPGQTSSNLVRYVRESGFQNSAATVGEGDAKPQSDMTFEEVSSPVVKIAHYVKASTEILMDAPMLRSYIDGRLRYGLKLIEEGQLLNGSGVGNNLEGLMTAATAYAAPIAIAGENNIDILRLAILQSELAEFPATGIVLNPANWAAIELTKDDNGGYIFANPQTTANHALWGRPVVGTQAMAANDFLVGAFQMGAQIFDRMQDTVTVATENEDDFINNLVTILAEERLAMAIYRPEAFVKGELTPFVAD